MKEPGGGVTAGVRFHSRRTCLLWLRRRFQLACSLNATRRLLTYCLPGEATIQRSLLEVREVGRKLSKAATSAEKYSGATELPAAVRGEQRRQQQQQRRRQEEEESTGPRYYHTLVIDSLSTFDSVCPDLGSPPEG